MPNSEEEYDLFDQAIEVAIDRHIPLDSQEFEAFVCSLRFLSFLLDRCSETRTRFNLRTQEWQEQLACDRKWKHDRKFHEDGDHTVSKVWFLELLIEAVQNPERMSVEERKEAHKITRLLKIISGFSTKFFEETATQASDRGQAKGVYTCLMCACDLIRRSAEISH